MKTKKRILTLSIIVPIYNEEESIPAFYDKIKSLSFLMPINILLYFIDDGSTDNSVSIIKKITYKDDKVHYVVFSRHFGKEAAIYAGLQHSCGEYVAVMDVDLQDPPELLPKMIKMITEEQWDVIGTRRINRGEKYKIRSFFSNLFYKMINLVSDSQLVPGERDYRVMERKVVDSILLLSESQRFSRGIFSWVGFRTKYLTFENVDRVKGKTSWTFLGLMKYAVDGVVSFSTIPLTFVILIGLLSFSLSVLGAIFVVARAILDKNSSIAGWASMITTLLFISSIQLLSLGVIGKYISAIFLETKQRPIYIKRESK